MSDEDWDDENFQDVIVESPQYDEMTIRNQNGEELKTYIIKEEE